MIDYDSKYIFRYANTGDIDAIMKFINDDWRQNHILAKNRELFEYEFLEENGDVNFLLAIDKDRNSIEGVIGFLKTAYDSDITDIWTSIWKVKDGNMLFLGTEIQKRLESDERFRFPLSVGDNIKTSARILKKKFGRHIVKMNHYYILSDSDNFEIAVIKNFPKETRLNKISANIVEIKTVNEICDILENNDYASSIPIKDCKYYEKRFLKHPIYKYNIYKIEDNNKSALFVTRNQACNSKKVLRIVDYFGNNELIEDLGIWLREKVNSDGFEYADFLCYGFDEKPFINGGFSLLSEDDVNIIPDYFSPFEQRNIDILSDTPIENITICKADGDQDRPN